MELAHVVFRPPPGDAAFEESMRARKKARNRLAIQRAALGLFAERGYEETTVEQIAQRADVSYSTFFRHFGGKADTVMTGQASHLPMLSAAIMAQPLSLTDVEAIRRALQEVWVPNVEPALTLQTRCAVARSLMLRGMADEIGTAWADAVTTALVERRGDPAARDMCRLAGLISLGQFGSAVRRWLDQDAEGDLADLVDGAFALFDLMLAGGRRS